MPQLLKPTHLEPMLCNKRSHCSETPTHRIEDWPPLAATRECPRSNEDPTQPKIKKKKRRRRRRILTFLPSHSLSVGGHGRICLTPPNTSESLSSLRQSSRADDGDGMREEGEGNQSLCDPPVTLSWLNTLWEIRVYSSFPQQKRKCLQH